MSYAFEAYDEADLEGAFEDLEYDEGRDERQARRTRRRQRRQNRRHPAAVPVPPPPPPSRAADANLRRDRELAKAVNVVNDDVSDMDARLAKVNADLGKLKMLSLFPVLLARGPSVSLKRLELVPAPSTASGPTLIGIDNPSGTPAPGQVDVVGSVTQKADLTPALLTMMMSRDVGKPGRAGAAAGSGDMMPMLMVLLLLPQLSGQTGTTGGAQTTGGLDPTFLILMMMMMGGGL